MKIQPCDHRGIVIEFIGAPGSGKSSLVSSSVDFLQSQGISALKIKDAIYPFAQRTFLGKVAPRMLPPELGSRMSRYLFTLYGFMNRFQFARKHPQLVYYVHRLQFARPKEAQLRRRGTLIQYDRLTGYYEFLMSHILPCEMVVFDEGLVHKVVQLHISEVEEPDTARISHYLDLLPQPDIVVHINTPLSKCKNRVLERGVWKHMSDKSPQQITHFLTNAHRTVNLAVNYMRSNNWCVIHVDNSQDDIQLAEEDLRNQLKGVFQHI